MTRATVQYVLRSTPDHRQGACVRRHGSRDGIFGHFIYADVLEELRFAAEYREENCVALLEGAIGMDGAGPFVEIDGFSGLEYVEHFPGAYRSLRKEMKLSKTEKTHGRHLCLGMLVAARGSGAQLTLDAARLQLSLFNLEFQVVLMMDPEENKVALYNQMSPGSFANIGFSVVHPEPSAAASAENVLEEGGELPEGCDTSTPSG